MCLEKQLAMFFCLICLVLLFCCVLPFLFCVLLCLIYGDIWCFECFPLYPCFVASNLPVCLLIPHCVAVFHCVWSNFLFYCVLFGCVLSLFSSCPFWAVCDPVWSVLPDYVFLLLFFVLSSRVSVFLMYLVLTGCVSLPLSFMVYWHQPPSWVMNTSAKREINAVWITQRQNTQPAEREWGLQRD